jgi:hypothetical protein
MADRLRQGVNVARIARVAIFIGNWGEVFKNWLPDLRLIDLGV